MFIKLENNLNIYICLNSGEEWYGWIFRRDEDQEFVSVRKATLFEIELAEKQAKGGE